MRVPREIATMRALLAVVGLSLLFAAPARADVAIQYFTLPAELKGATNGARRDT